MRCSKRRCACRHGHHDHCSCCCPCRRHPTHWLFFIWLFSGVVVLAKPILRIWLREGPGDTDGGTLATSPRPSTGAPQIIPGTIYRRPDPMIYDQYYLMSQGLAVTWDNPDIRVERLDGTPVPSHELLPGTMYRVVAHIWNLSEQAPAINLPVRVSFLTFGIGTTRTFIDETFVNLPVKGSPALPVSAQVEWTTPPAPGHYCLQVELIWPDDANPNNNLGQHNTDVKALASPAVFEFPLRNETGFRARRMRLVADAYQIPPLLPCDAVGARGTDGGARGQRERVVARHAPANFAVPAGWHVAISPTEITLAPNQEELVTVTVTAPTDFTGRQPFNVNAFDGPNLVGGVTLYVDGV